MVGCRVNPLKPKQNTKRRLEWGTQSFPAGAEMANRRSIGREAFSGQRSQLAGKPVRLSDLDIEAHFPTIARAPPSPSGRPTKGLTLEAKL